MQGRRIPGTPILLHGSHTRMKRKDTCDLLKQVAWTWDIIVRCSLQENRELKGSDSPYP